MKEDGLFKSFLDNRAARKTLSPLRFFVRSPEEKKRGRERILTLIGRAPQELTSRGRFLAFGALTPNRTALALGGVAAFVVLAGAGGTVMAAEKALPGDPLYAFKVDGSEQVRAEFLSSPEAKAAWDLERLKRRMAEADELAARGQLDEGRKQVAETQANRQAAALDSYIYRLEQENRFEAAQQVRAGIQEALSSTRHIEAAGTTSHITFVGKAEFPDGTSDSETAEKKSDATELPPATEEAGHPQKGTTAKATPDRGPQTSVTAKTEAKKSASDAAGEKKGNDTATDAGKTDAVTGTAERILQEAEDSLSL